MLKYCLICGIIGHATQVSKEFLDADRACGTVSKNLDDNLVYRGLDAVTNLRGNPLRSGFRSGGSIASNEGRHSPRRWREMKSDEQDETWQGLRSSLVVGMKGDDDNGWEGSSSRGHSAAREEHEMSDAGGSPCKLRGSLCQNENGGNSLADKIRRQRGKKIWQ